jgi:hypothetical protein
MPNIARPAGMARSNVVDMGVSSNFVVLVVPFMASYDFKMPYLTDGRNNPGRKTP